MSGNNEQSATAEFDEFVAAGEVEVGVPDSVSEEKEQPKKPAAKAAPKAEAKQEIPADEEAEDQGDTDEGADDEAENQDDDGEDDQKPSEGHLKRLKRERAEAKREARELKARLAAVENSTLLQRLENLEKGLSNENSGANSADKEKPAPDPTDTEVYPLGHLDDRYIEDKLEWLSEKKAAERADAVLQRQQENEQGQKLQQEQTELLGKVDDLATRGSELFEDFQENVVEAGMRGEWDLSRETFEAAHEAENGVQILYELSQDKKEASRVAKLSPYQQLKFVQERDAEIGQGKKPRLVPKAGEPPKNTARGANSRTQINPATDNLDDFEKAWELDAKRGSR